VFERLREWRAEQAKEASVPAYVVFTDLTLIALAEALPTTDSELLAVSGVGLTKLERYGADVMAICAVAPGTGKAAGAPLRNVADNPSGDPVGNG
jgi:DNA helicase-2/ATP-dependent DNA helicase PcrA